MGRKTFLSLLLTILGTGTVTAGGEIPLTLQERFPDEGETCGIKFLTSLKSLEDLVKRDYHIVEFSLEGKLSLPLTAHLFKREDRTPSHIFSEVEHAHFHGYNVEEGMTVSFVATVPKGTKEWNGIGFHGYVSRNGETFVFEPHFQFEGSMRRRRSPKSPNACTVKPEERDQQNQTLPHKVFPAAKATENLGNSSRFDVLRVPKEEMEKAVKEMEEDERKASNSTSSTSVEEEDEEDSSGVVATAGTLLQTYAKKGKKKPKGKKNPAVKPDAQRIVDIAVFADKPLHKIWEDRYPKQSTVKLKEFVLNLVNNMHLHYQQPSLGTKLAFRLVHLEIMTSDPKSLETNGGQAEKYLKSFCKYAGDKNRLGQQWDHALLLTGLDIEEKNDKSLLANGKGFIASV